MTKLYSFLALTVVVATLGTSSACEGRDPLVTQRNADAVIPPPPPPPPPEVRTLGSKRLFGTMPAQNRFDDPLFTYTAGASWYGYSNELQEYAAPVRMVGASPTQTPFLQLSAENNRGGATMIAQVKTATTPLHVEIWVGRDGDGASFDSMGIALLGLFVDVGESAVELAADESSRVDVDGRTWMKFTADIDEGPLGWSTFIAADNESGTTFYLGGPVAVDLDLVTPNAALRLASKRPMTATEKLLAADASERSRNLGNGGKRADARPPLLPGVPR